MRARDGNATTPKSRTILVIAICRAGIIVVTFSYLALFVGTLLGILFPQSKIGKFVTLVAYLALVIFFVYRTYRLWCRECDRCLKRATHATLPAHKKLRKSKKRPEKEKNEADSPTTD